MRRPLRRPLRLLGACLCASGVLWALGLAYGQDAIPFAAPPGQQALASSAGGEETTPITIFGAKLVAWYRADLGVTGSAPVTAWNDSSGNGHHLTASGTPELVTDGGDSAIDFEAGDSDSLERAASITGSDEPFTVYVVASPESVHSGALFSVSTDGSRVGGPLAHGSSNNYFMLRTLNNGGKLQTQIVTRGTSNTTNTNQSTNRSTATRYLYRARWTSDTDRGVRVDEEAEATTSTSRTVSGTDYTTIGARKTATRSDFFDGLIFEVVVLNADPSAGEDTDYLAYLDAKWNIPGVTSTPPLGPSDPYVPPLLLAAAGLALLALSLRRRPASRTPEAPSPAPYALDEAAPGLPMTHDLDEVLRMRAAIETFHWQEVDARRARTLCSVAEAGRRAARRAA